MLYPCNNTYNGSCNVACRHGFQVSGKAGIVKWRQTCEHFDDGPVAWRNSETCTGQCEGTCNSILLTVLVNIFMKYDSKQNRVYTYLCMGNDIN